MFINNKYTIVHDSFNKEIFLSLNEKKVKWVYLKYSSKIFNILNTKIPKYKTSRIKKNIELKVYTILDLENIPLNRYDRIDKIGVKFIDILKKYISDYDVIKVHNWAFYYTKNENIFLYDYYKKQWFIKYWIMEYFIKNIDNFNDQELVLFLREIRNYKNYWQIN